ncbi:hypothetical protein [Streptomyces atratus]|uniref:hypothetical protein n=1 Tax=Streptomyces atratus TaxID=1893 RepID=UPI003403B1C1
MHSSMCANTASAEPVHRAVRQRQRLAYVVHRGGNLLGHALGAGRRVRLLQADRTEVGRPGR